MKVCHLTSAHPRYDPRIFVKQCRSLAKHGFDVSLVVADGKGDEVNGSVKIYDVGGSTGRLDRMVKTTNRVFHRALSIDADIYHFHDPELMPVGLRLKKRDKKVILDSHEDVPKQIVRKPYLNPVISLVLSKVVAVFEHYISKKMDAIVAATPAIESKFLVFNDATVNINNYPLLDEFCAGEMINQPKKKQICYVGVISEARGIKEVVAAMALTREDVVLGLAGQFSSGALQRELESTDGWSSVEYYGVLNREAVRDVLLESFAGIVTFLDSPNHVEAQPTKMFEYMSAGLPVIASHFPLWKTIIEGNHCGLCVDPDSPTEIAGAMDYLATHPEEALTMGKNGVSAVRGKYNWEVEELKLVKLYKEMIVG